ncbi:hypothetical protein JZ751_020531 [Albula glossodonta]|uniref:Uncharacterized protein n=1 Tax=Albula glossodonta TaxID=121402 RepID=A0A8T2PN94_9TELE|nr:hypothetical protein JZ751_020531 [Albula glossodonta]
MPDLLLPAVLLTKVRQSRDRERERERERAKEREERERENKAFILLNDQGLLSALCIPLPHDSLRFVGESAVRKCYADQYVDTRSFQEEESLLCPSAPGVVTAHCAGDAIVLSKYHAQLSQMAVRHHGNSIGNAARGVMLGVWAQVGAGAPNPNTYAHPRLGPVVYRDQSTTIIRYE